MNLLNNKLFCNIAKHLQIKDLLALEQTCQIALKGVRSIWKQLVTPHFDISMFEIPDFVTLPLVGEVPVWKLIHLAFNGHKNKMITSYIGYQGFQYGIEIPREKKDYSSFYGFSKASEGQLMFGPLYFQNDLISLPRQTLFLEDKVMFIGKDFVQHDERSKDINFKFSHLILSGTGTMKFLDHDLSLTSLWVDGQPTTNPESSITAKTKQALSHGLCINTLDDKDLTAVMMNVCKNCLIGFCDTCHPHRKCCNKPDRIRFWSTNYMFCPEQDGINEPNEPDGIEDETEDEPDETEDEE